MEIKDLHKLYLINKSISTDSRNINSGCLFFALKGDNFNGNKFAKEAIEKGAAYSIIDEKEYQLHPNCILVDHVLETLQKLANYHRKQLNIPLIGITGSNGKTTTKELLHAVLNAEYKTYATKGNLNNHIGVPLTLLAIDESYKMAIIEMGANHLGEIDALCKIAEPDFGLITNVGKAHLEGFGSFEGVIKTKTELYRFVNQKKGVLFVNGENEILVNEANKQDCRKIYYGTSSTSQINSEVIESSPFLRIKITNKSENVVINSNLAGNYNKENITAAACVGGHFNISLQKIAQAISDYIPSNNRSQLQKSNLNILLCDYYNANPSSMEAALHNFQQATFEYSKKIIMIGGMKELGSESEKEHQKIVELTINMKFDEVYLVGDEFLNCKINGFKLFRNSEELSKHLQENPITQSSILIKGSRGSKMELVVPYL